MRFTRLRMSDGAAGILEAREERYHEKCELCARFRLPVLSVMLNIPGTGKTGPLYRSAVERMAGAIGALLGDAVCFSRMCDSQDGPYALFAVQMAGDALKNRMVELEESHPAGRFFDLDVMAADGSMLSRTLMGRPPRACYLCGRPARECSTLRRHPPDELRALVDEALMRYLMTG